MDLFASEPVISGCHSIPKCKQTNCTAKKKKSENINSPPFRHFVPKKKTKRGQHSASGSTGRRERETLFTNSDYIHKFHFTLIIEFVVNNIDSLCTHTHTHSLTHTQDSLRSGPVVHFDLSLNAANMCHSVTFNYGYKSVNAKWAGCVERQSDTHTHTTGMRKHC